MYQVFYSIDEGASIYKKFGKFDKLCTAIEHLHYLSDTDGHPEMDDLYIENMETGRIVSTPFTEIFLPSCQSSLLSLGYSEAEIQALIEKAREDIG